MRGSFDTNLHSSPSHGDYSNDDLIAYQQLLAGPPVKYQHENTPLLTSVKNSSLLALRYGRAIFCFRTVFCLPANPAGKRRGLFIQGRSSFVIRVSSISGDAVSVN